MTAKIDTLPSEVKLCNVRYTLQNVRCFENYVPRIHVSDDFTILRGIRYWVKTLTRKYVECKNTQKSNKKEMENEQVQD